MEEFESFEGDTSSGVKKVRKEETPHGITDEKYSLITF
jgi:hypothetical protein